MSYIMRGYAFITLIKFIMQTELCQNKFIMLVYKILGRPNTHAQCIGPSKFSQLYTSHTLRYFATNSQVNSRIDYYKILGVPTTAQHSQIKSQFYTLAKKYHPDSGSGNEDKFKLINEAYTVLSNQNTKRQYDSLRSSSRPETDRQTYSQRTQKSYYNHNQSDWAQYRRGKPSQNPYRRKSYGDPHADIFQMLRQRDEYFRRSKMSAENQYQQDLRQFIESMKRYQMEENIRQERRRQMQKIVREMQRQHEEYERKIFESTLVGRLGFWMWNTGVNIAQWVIRMIKKHKK